MASERARPPPLRSHRKDDRKSEWVYIHDAALGKPKLFLRWVNIGDVVKKEGMAEDGNEIHIHLPLLSHLLWRPWRN
jgi:hypothetical protein